MIIGIDGNEANNEIKVGVHQYAFEILWSFYRITNNRNKEVTFWIYLNNVPKKDLPPENKYWKYKIIKGDSFWIITRLMFELLKLPRPDVFFSPSHYLPLFTLMPKVCTIHDLGYLKDSGQFRKRDFWQLKLWSATSIFVAKKVIAVSESTKKDIVRHYKFASKKSNIIYHGYDKTRFNTKITHSNVRQVENKYYLSKNYILFLGTLKPSKNIEGIIDALAILVSNKSEFVKKDFKLVIAGKKGWLYDEIYEKVKKHKLDKHVVFTGYLPEKDKAALIKGAKLFLSPSFWEGFGMQVLEAMAVGTPVVVSDIASLPEVAGDAGIYVNPRVPSEIAKAIEKVISMDKVSYTKLQSKLLKQSEKFSWEKAGKETLDTLLSAIS